MTVNTLRTVTLLFFVIASALGLTVVLMLAVYVPTVPTDTALRKPVIGIIFMAICVFGGLAALYPKKCSRVFDSHGEGKSVTFHTVYAKNYDVRGHHPDCGKFSSHVIKTKEHVLCAACTGLFLGAVVAAVGTSTYFFVGLEIEQISLSLTAVGVGFVILGFTQFRFKSVMRLVLNVLFVIGAFFVIIGMDALTKNLPFDYYVISFIIFWVLTRILLSEWDHMHICRLCTNKCKNKM